MGTSNRTGLASLYTLLCLLIAQLGLYQVAVPAAKPKDPGQAPPGWHQVLEYLGLFLFYFASALAFAVLLSSLSRVWARREYPPLLRAPMVLLGAIFAALAAIAIVTQADADAQFLFETTFVGTLLCLVFAQANRAGSLRAKLGLALLATPFGVHFYGPLWARWSERLVADSDLPEKLSRMGQWTLAIAALAMPVCFGPRPLFRALRRPGPMGAAVVACFVSTLIVTGSYEVSAELAYKGLGIDIGPGAPRGVIALYVLALGAGTWTLIACLGSQNPWRQQIGVGVGLVGVAGYGFQWPVQYLSTLVGLIAIGEAAGRVGREVEDDAAPPFRAPPISDGAWAQYLQCLKAALDWRDLTLAKEAEGEGVADIVRGETEGRGAAIRLLREHGAVTKISVRVGKETPAGDEPFWVLAARPEDRVVGVHPPPPSLGGREARTGDDIFDRRFALVERGPWTAALLDEPHRTRAVALLDGWVAIWDGGVLEYTVYPGRGAPVDSPVPITELAFRSDAMPESAERLTNVVSFLVELAIRASGLPE